ncbi:unnamed protein product [Zymoseptoria tritici ST99CH_1E4]|uniref:Enolase-phosphatase E1 n=1 Tax=Zymoseptoria tritici ST99CH_1E4 TaxID=1276532 RepID=A0A2H1FYG1_ZYMTR|nr:unnamed protein product [Zymoseptoria tritici ST99CH_1E4]
MEDIKLILLDIEGTICEIAFVKSVLCTASYSRLLSQPQQFPYAIGALPTVLSEKWSDPAFAAYRDAFPEAHRESPKALQAHVEDLTARDVKVAYLKNLQGYLWEEGYKSGAYSTPLFPDVVPKLRDWRRRGLELAIYSSGSVFAQKLLFGHVQAESSESGSHKKVEDLTELFGDEAWFDTTNAGLKTEASSYAKIAESLKFKPSTMLFLSDNVKEVDAAIEAGMQSILVDRPGNAAVSEADRSRLQVVTSLDEIEITGQSKK